MAGMSKMKPGLASDAVNLAFIEAITADADAVQGRVLSEILGRNGESEYLTEKCGGLSGSASVDVRAAFRAKVPMATYEDLLPYIRRIADGDRSAILTGTANPVTELFTSSGTSGGERKMIPTVEDEVDRRYLLEGLFTTVMNQHAPGIDKGKSMYFLFVSSQSKTAGGLTAGTVMTSYYKSKQYAGHAYPQNNTSPTAAILCEDAAQSTYAQMLCGLCQRRDVMHVGAVFAVALVRAVRFLQDNWERLAADIDAGELLGQGEGGGVITDPAVREAVAGVLRRPDPELAAFVRAECGKGDWAGIIPRIWPNTKYLGTVVTGSMAQYVPTLNYYSGGLPMASDIWGASEGDFGLNLSPLCDPYEASYTIMPNMAYFEFLPVVDDGDSDAASNEDQLVELAKVEAGKEYEMVITTYAGLNRYRLGDVLRVTGFHNAAPMVRFVRRKNTLLSIDVDKTDEAELQAAVERASALLRPHGAAVVEYTSRACTAAVPGRYVIYWELRTDKEDTVVNDNVLERCCLEMEEALSTVYRQKRVEDGSIAPLQVRVVQPATFDKLLDYAISRGTSIAQYKVPRCVTENPPLIDLLDSRVVSTHVSSALPHWAPDQPSSNK
ncbi:hypothetical protein EJB05_53806, partial [Eragrostis curvula]